MMHNDTTHILESLETLSVIRHKRQRHAVEAALTAEVDSHSLDDPSLAVIFMNEMIKTISVLDEKNAKLAAENKQIKDMICSVMDMYEKVRSEKEKGTKVRRFSCGVQRNNLRRYHTRRNSFGDKARAVLD